MSTADERAINPIYEMNRIAQSILALDARHFRQSYRSPELHELIFDSEWCRISFIWEGWDYRGGNSMQIHYGRLHAPNEKATMFWLGEECNCWHDFNYALHFLDKRTPIEAAALDISHPLTDPFYEENFRSKFYRRQPEWLAQMHLEIWNHYGLQFFELFDLRRPDLWERYRYFLKEVYDLQGRIPEIVPPLDKVC